MEYVKPEIEILKFDCNDVTTDVTIISGHRPGNGDVSYEDFI